MQDEIWAQRQFWVLQEDHSGEEHITMKAKGHEMAWAALFSIIILFRNLKVNRTQGRVCVEWNGCEMCELQIGRWEAEAKSCPDVI